MVTPLVVVPSMVLTMAVASAIGALTAPSAILFAMRLLHLPGILMSAGMATLTIERSQMFAAHNRLIGEQEHWEQIARTAR
jgi:hypothetical protein